jgi:hypothetical protein
MMPVPLNVLWLSDSIYASGMPVAVAGAAPPEWNMSHTKVTVGGTVTGQGLFEVADATYAYESGSWVPKSRGVALSAYNSIVFEFGRNETEAASDYAKAYEKIIEKAINAGITRIVASVCPPKASPGLATWATDTYDTGGLRAARSLLPVKWNVQDADTYTQFLGLVSAGTYQISDLMAPDGVHMTINGLPVAADLIADMLTADPLAPNAATPDIAGDVINYLFGEPGAGWTITNVTATSISPVLYRVSGLTDKAYQSSGSGQVLTFPAAQFEQVWVHYFLGTSGGSFTLYIDRGLPGEVSRTISTFGQAGYPRSAWGAVGLSAASHTVEIETTTANPVQIIGVTYVGVP